MSNNGNDGNNGYDDAVVEKLSIDGPVGLGMQNRLQDRKTAGQGYLHVGNEDRKAVYNPVSGKELGKVLVNRLWDSIQGAGAMQQGEILERWAGLGYLGGVKSRVYDKIVRDVDSLNDEVLAFPKAQVMVKAVFRFWQEWWEGLVELKVMKWPYEEMRMVEAQLVVQEARIPGSLIPPMSELLLEIELTDEFNTDEIPPDALRILHDLPMTVPTPTVGSGLDGGSSIVDQVVTVSEEQKAAVREQYGSTQPSSIPSMPSIPVVKEAPVKMGGGSKVLGKK